MRWWHRLLDALAAGQRRAEHWLTGERHALHALAAARMGIALAVLGLLVTNFSDRQIWVGDASAWAEPARMVSQFPEIALLDGVSGDLLTVVYVVVLLCSLALLVGWRTKAMTVVVLVGFIAVTAQNPVLGTLGDNLIRLTLLWMLLMRTGDVWSLDAAREREETEAVPDWLRTGLHNVGLVGLASQTALAYLAGGFDKVAQPAWQQGTALYATLQLPEFRPFPWLSDLIANASVLLAVVTWTVLAVQLFFVPLVLLRPWTRDAVVLVAFAINTVFAVVLATPWSSLAVIAVTGLFLSDRRWAAFGERVLDVLQPLSDRTIDVRYAIYDRLEDAWYRYVLGTVDWVRVTVFRR